jgi:hypothetical protein
VNAVRLTSTLGAGVVAGIAAWASYSHMSEVALRVGERADVAYLVPLSVDGLLVVASAAMLDDKRVGRKPRLSARIAFGIGIAASVSANIAHAHPTVGARIVAAWPAFALLLVVELLARRGRTVEAAISPAKSQVSADVEPAKSGARKAAPKAAKVAAVVKSRPDLATGEAAKLAGVSTRTARRVINGAPVLDEVTR